MSRAATFVLIHGAWHGAWCWQKLSQMLTLAGHRVIAPDLPGSGQDRTPLANVTFASSVERVLDLINRGHEPVVLVGHPLGGMTVSQVAEEVPEKIRWLVYLTALLPCDGETAFSLQTNMMQHASLPTWMEFDDVSVRLRLSEAEASFYHDCAAEEQRLAQKLLKPQALHPMQTSVSLSQRFASVPRAYLTCLQDRVLSPEFQAQMYARTPCERVLTLASGHSPFFSMPEQLAARLEDFALDEPASSYALAV